MAFIPKTWVDDQIVYAEDMNRIEQGIADAVSITPQTLSDEQKTRARNNINAAPGGYGLGGNGHMVGDWNTCLSNGWYQGNGSTLNGPDKISASVYGAMLVVTRYSNIYQLFVNAAKPYALPQTMARRWTEDGSVTWSEWEYINPPFIKDVVYRTTDRHLGKPVYKKMDSKGVIWWSTDQSTWRYESERVGAAPAGYGLGDYMGLAIDANTPGGLNAATKCGWYYFGGNSPIENVPTGVSQSNYGYLLVCSRTSDSSLTQFAFFETYDNIAIRHRSVTTWGPWEWLNPPMELGMEYRTTERYLGKPVYVRVVDFGAMPNNTIKVVTFGDNTMRPVSAHGIMAGEYVIPGCTGADGYPTQEMQIFTSPGQVGILTHFDRSEHTAKVIVKYWKTTD